MIFADPIMLILALLALPVAFWRRPRTQVAHSNVGNNPATPFSHRVVFLLPRLMLACAVALAAVALAQPQKIDEKPSESTIQGRDIMLALDYSYSMAAPFEGALPQAKSKEKPTGHQPEVVEQTDDEGDDRKPRRIDAALAAILAFVDTRDESNGGDAVGLIAFDRRPVLRWPLDPDLKQIIRHGNFLPKGKAPGGFGEGTNFGAVNPGPIDLAAEHFSDYGHSKTRVLILVTDGEDKLPAEAMTRLEGVLRNAGIRLYVIGVGLPKEGVDITKLAQRVSDNKECVFRVGNGDDLAQCFSKISQMESSPVPADTVRKHEELFFVPFVLALAFALAWALLEALLFGR